MGGLHPACAYEAVGVLGSIGKNAITMMTAIIHPLMILHGIYVYILRTIDAP